MSTQTQRPNNKKEVDLNKADQDKQNKDNKQDTKPEEGVSKKDQNKKETPHKDDKQKPNENEDKEAPGVFSKLGKILSSIFEGAKEIVMPNLSENEDKDKNKEGKEAKKESKDEHTKSKSLKEEKPLHENKDHSEKHETNKYLVQTLSGKDSEESNDKGRDKPTANLN